MLNKIPLNSIPDDELWFEYDAWVNAAARRLRAADCLRRNADKFDEEALAHIMHAGRVFEEITWRGVKR